MYMIVLIIKIIDWNRFANQLIDTNKDLQCITHRETERQRGVISIHFTYEYTGVLLSCGLFARTRCFLAACYEVYVCCEIIGRMYMSKNIIREVIIMRSTPVM